MPWILREGEENSPTYERSLGLNELQFYHRAHVLQGSTDSLQEVSFEVDPQTATISESTVRDAWIATKCRFPLLGARVEVAGLEDKDVRFVVELDRIRDVKPGEILWSSISSAEDATEFIDKLINQQRILDDVYLVRVFVLKRLDRDNCYHILVHAAHCVVDGMSYYSIMRFLLETLSTADLTSEENIKSRLALSIPSEDLFPVRKSSLARQRWHRAIGHVIYNVRSQNQTGGHALPGTYTTNLILKPARSSSIFTQFTAAQSTAVTSACRKHGFTFGNAYPIIGQMAMARVLSRRYSQGLMSEEEWQWRRSQPMWAAGPLNLRPYLNQEWYRQGGADTAMLAIGFFFYRIPSMPLRLNKEGSVPPFNALLSQQRFVHRCLMMKKQANVYLKHPLFLEVVAARFPAMLQDIKELYAKRNLPFEDHPLDQQEMGKTSLVIAMGGSSIGRIDGMLPRNYPLNKNTPSIKIISTATRLRCRPGEIYLGASSYENIMTLNVFWDSNVTDKELVGEWLSEVKNATLCYLGGGERAAKL